MGRRGKIGRRYRGPGAARSSRSGEVGEGKVRQASAGVSDLDLTTDLLTGELESRHRAELGERLGGFVYGTIVALSVIVTGLKAFPHDLGRVALLVAVTTIVFFLAHVYAHGIAFSIGHDEHLSLEEFRRIARREASIVEAGVLPAAALLLGGIGLLSSHVATWLAFGLGLVVLGVVGVIFARVERLGPGPSVVAVLANLALGLGLIGLKVFVVH
jgi:hypothetical protein